MGVSTYMAFSQNTFYFGHFYLVLVWLLAKPDSYDKAFYNDSESGLNSKMVISTLI